MHRPSEAPLGFIIPQAPQSCDPGVMNPGYGKFAPVCPAPMYREFFIRGYIPQTVLLLAHDVVANAEDYYDTFLRIRPNIIMDNSLIELGGAIDLKTMSEAMSIANTDIAVLPDALNDGVATVNLLHEHYGSWKWEFKDKKLMALIQGSTIQDWLYCAEQTAKYDIDWIGVPRCMEGISGYSRKHYVDFVKMIFPHKPIHLFGFSDEPWEDMFAAKDPAVKSIDSAAPLRLNHPNVLSGDPGPRGDWWSKAKFDPVMIETMMKINQYIRA